jgi:hypothetical protein
MSDHLAPAGRQHVGRLTRAEQGRNCARGDTRRFSRAVRGVRVRRVVTRSERSAFDVSYQLPPLLGAHLSD